MTKAETLIFIPTYNEAENVEGICAEILGVGLNVDLLFVDDNSADGTGQILDRLSEKNNRVHVIHRAGKMGIGSAHQEGIQWAYAQGYRVLITMDCDYTHSPKSLPDFIVQSGAADIVVGSRYILRHSLAGWNLFRKLMTLAGHFVTKYLLRMEYDATGAFRLYRLDRIPRAVFDLVKSRGYAFFFESLFALKVNGFKIQEIPIVLPARTCGNSKMDLREVLRSVLQSIHLYKTIILKKNEYELAFSSPHNNGREGGQEASCSTYKKEGAGRHRGFRSAWELLALGVILGANAVFLYRSAFRQLNFFDMASILDAGWRVFQGQRVYGDFIYNVGPMHLYMHALFFKIFGFGKLAIWAHVTFLSSVITGLAFFTFRKTFPLWLNGAVTLLTVSAFCWGIAHPWYDQLAHFWGLLAVFFLFGAIPFPSKRYAFGSGALCGLLTVLSVMSKTNIGMAYGLVFAGIFLTTRFRFFAIVGLLLAGSLGAFGFVKLFIPCQKEFFEQIFFHSQAVAGLRAARLMHPSSWMINQYWVAPSVVLLNVIFSRKTVPALFLLLGVSFIAIFAANTGNILPDANIFLWGIQAALALAAIQDLQRLPRPDVKIKILNISKIFLVLWAFVLLIISMRYGLELKVWTYTKKPLGTHALKSAPLDGWRVTEFQGKALDDLVQFVKRYVSPQDSLLNLTDMYLIYALTGRGSYKGIPFIFSEMNIPAPGEQTAIVRNNILSHPPEWIIAHVGSWQEEFRFLGLQEEIRRHYRPVYRTGFYFLLKRIP